ncbi:MAG: L-lactate permease [Halothiobacillaceae bacterium]|jgi:lactate permease|nr:L-lactate permease [Halothiobacillaceae bacterium]
MPLALSAGLSALPIVTILGLMLIWRWSAARAGLAGLVLALALAWLLFGFGQGGRDLPATRGTAGALLEAVFISLTILWIIFPALCIHHLQVRTGATDHIRALLAHVSDDPRIVAIVVAWFFALFLEGVAGFGTPIALAAPLLVGAGFSPITAVILVLIGHAVGVSFGAVGTPVMAQEAATGLPGAQIAAATAAYHAPLGWLMLMFMVWLVARARPEDMAGRGPVWGWALLAGGLFLLPYYLIARFIGPELPTLGGALIGGVAFVLIHRAWYARLGQVEALSLSGRQIVAASLPYLVLLGLILVSRLVPPVTDALRSIEWSWRYADVFSGRIQPLYHPGTLLFLGFLGAAWMRRTPTGVVWEAMRLSAIQLVGVTLALLAMLALARVMLHADMITTLATAAASAGGIWPFLAPFVGVLGSFVTGSATASNILFSDFQKATAEALGKPVLPLVAAQGFGAAVGNLICPHNVIAGCATVGLKDREGEILARTLIACLVYAACGGALALWVYAA